jgi:Transposase IS4
MKTVQVVTELCKQYEGSHRTVYVDRFYTLHTSLELMKELYKMSLYATGTVLKNRVPKEPRPTKTSAEFKAMTRGDFRRYVYVYQDPGW